mmetsp:Transcript_3244/g.12115  ORF Transcript_3244/g.12115 Transcript_3244/m.12115 type:complete len:249 (+) Transcript_3244:2001-2747(+)
MIETLGVRSYVSYIVISSIIENKPSRGYPTCRRSSSGSLTAISTSVGGPRTRTNSPFVDCTCAFVSTSLDGATCVPLGEFGPRRPNKKFNPSGGSAGGAGVAGIVSKLARQLGQVLCCASHSSMQSLWNTCWHVGMVLITSLSSNCSMHTEQLGSSPAHLLAFQSASVNSNCGMASIISRGQPVCCAALPPKPPFWFQVTVSSRPRIRRLSTCPCSIHLHTLRSRHMNIAMMITSTTDMNDGGIMSSS